MNVVITGATGFIGRKLVSRLLVEGHAVLALTRNVEAARLRLPERCGCVLWNPPDGPEPRVLQTADAIVHLAGEGVAERRWTRARRQAIRQSRVAGTHALVTAVAALDPAARPPVLISASAVGYYGDRGDERLDEGTRPGNDFLARVCQEWEKEALAAQVLGVRTVVVRIGIVLGKGGGALEKILPPFRLGLGGRLGSGRQWMSWIHLDDLASLLMFLIGHRAAAGSINAVAPVPVTNAAFASALGRALGRPTVLPVPAIALRLALGEMSTVLLASQRVLPRAAERLGFVFRYPELGSALAELCAVGGR
ncbi:MAG: TIGR01777 family oxidoreductase [Candidatus Binatia bacterium]